MLVFFQLSSSFVCLGRSARMIKIVLNTREFVSSPKMLKCEFVVVPIETLKIPRKFHDTYICELKFCVCDVDLQRLQNQFELNSDVIFYFSLYVFTKFGLIFDLQINSTLFLFPCFRSKFYENITT